LGHLAKTSDSAIAVFLCGDVIAGIGVDQIPHYHSDPTLREPHIRDAREL